MTDVPFPKHVFSLSVCRRAIGISRLEKAWCVWWESPIFPDGPLMYRTHRNGPRLIPTMAAALKAHIRRRRTVRLDAHLGSLYK